MMEGADDSAGEEDRSRKEGCLGCGANLDELEPRKEKRDHHRGKYLKEALDPEMNHPPAPVFGGDEMAALSVHEASGIEERNCNAGDEKECEQSPILALANQ